MDEQFAENYRFLIRWLMDTAERLLPDSPGKHFYPWARDIGPGAQDSVDVLRAWSGLGKDHPSDGKWIIVGELLAFRASAEAHPHNLWAAWPVTDRTRDFLIDMAHTILGSLEHTLKNLSGGAAILLNALKELAEAFKHIVHGGK